MNKYDVVVIGAGFGGRQSALTLRSMGLTVGMIEALDKVGGKAYVDEVNGFKFDPWTFDYNCPF